MILVNRVVVLAYLAMFEQENKINWSHPNEEDICGLEMPSSFNVGQELYVGMDFDSKDAVKNAVKQYVMKMYQSFKVLETKS